MISPEIAAHALPDAVSIYARYIALNRIGSPSGGKLLFCCDLDADGIATLLSASIAGAASLCVDADRNRLRHGMKQGFCDFVVNDLDEALRILKNEIRKKQPVSVCLSSVPEDCIAEMIERGVQPDLLAPQSSLAEAIQPFLQRGAVIVPEFHPDQGIKLFTWTAANHAIRALSALDALAAASLDPQRSDTTSRRHWLAASPRYLGRALGKSHCVGMNADESAQCLARLRAAPEVVESAVVLTLDGKDISL